MADGAPAALEATAHSTWGGDNVYALLLTLNGASAALIRYTHSRGTRRASLERIWGAALVSAVLAGLVE